MGFLQDTSDALNYTSWILNEAAFGDIRNVFGDNEYMHNFYIRKIGLYNKSYDFMINHLMRNIGNSEHVFDGYGTAIGELSNPFYNTITRVPWFYLDDYKNSTSNYINYIRAAYGATISVENINNGETNIFHLIDDASKVGYIDGSRAIEALVLNTDLIPNNNGAPDTMMGITSGFYNRETLRNAQVTNDKRISNSFGITSGVRGSLGIVKENIEQGKTYNKEVSPNSGRFEEGNSKTEKNFFSPLEFEDGPVYKSNYGHLADIGSYIGYYNSLSENSKKYLESNLYDKNKTYYPSIWSTNNKILFSGHTYLADVGVSVGHELTKQFKIINGVELKSIDEQQIRYVFETLDEHSNATDTKNGGVYVYTENENGSSPNITFASYNSGTRFSRYTSYGTGLTANDLLKKTNDSFKNGSYKTIIARFHTDYDDAESTDITQTAISKQYGLSHGRNLLKLQPDTDSEGYENPYCRVWTFHHQYHRLADAIRPFGYSPDELYSKYGFSAFTANHGNYGNGRERLEKYGTLNKNNGLVNITPIDSGDANRNVDIKNCMFSIENLAWKDSFSTDATSRQSYQTGGLSSEQKGPFGGRIMWFPPYDLKFQEDVNVNWNETNFIGRGEGIYTYTNTTRTGTLSFKLLVDHPSIINYWNGRGQDTGGTPTGTNDPDLQGPEQQILRFFAGCDMLTAAPIPLLETEVANSDEPIPSPDSQEIRFFVFFPNYYSGKDDGGDNAMKYITNGLGAGKARYANSNGTVDYRIPYAKAKSGYGGYEMIPGKPISMGSSAIESQNANDVFIVKDKVGNDEVALFAQEGNSTSQWWQRKWYYRVDKQYKDKDLLKENYIDTASFGLNSTAGLDKISETFSTENDNTLFSFADVYVAFDSNSNASEVLSGLYDKEKVNLLKNWVKQYGIKEIKCIGRASTQGRVNENDNLQIDRAKTVKDWLVSRCKFDTNKIKPSRGGVGGTNSGINNGDINSIAHKLWRCVEVVIELQKSVSKTVQDSLTEQSMPATPNTKVDANTTSDNLQRTNYLGTVDGYLDNFENTGVRKTFDITDLSANIYVQKRNPKDRLDSIRLHNLGDNINNLAFNYRNAVRNGDLNFNSAFDMAADFSNHSKYFQYDSLGRITNRGKSDYNYAVNEMKDIAAQDEVAGPNNSVDDKAAVVARDGENVNSTRTREGTNNNRPERYDNEATFFSMLEKEEPFLHHKISDKVKYFDPAFHSISPEGFNARLTFLQQCTRQGPTVGNSDLYTANNTANNLAFGRPPVCVLRIGDFYYTKIIIDGLTINFDPLTWDLNTEGIGVMPMIADVNLRFKFIGGSSLAGHITRLQNALSFNYYANTEVYDNRSELAEYDENGNLINFKPSPI